MIINSPTAKAKNYYTYSASGVKLRTEQRYDPNLNVSPVNTTNPANDGLADYMNRDYAGNIIYETAKNGSAITNRTRILVDGGYWENNVYYFYVTDHLGNNRVVVNQSGTVTQKNHYYPFGTAFADKYDNGTNQPYKYNGKELDGMHQLNLYDYSARYYESALGRFTSVDPRAEKYYSTSPYAYCLNNPLKYIDPRGDTVRVYTETEDWGHSWMSVGEGDDMVVYSFNPATTKKDMREKGEVEFLADGSFFVMKGDEAKAYNTRKSNVKGGMQVTVITDVSDEKMTKVITDFISNSTKLIYESEDGQRSTYRTDDLYNAATNNCTTFVSDMLNIAGSEILKSATTITDKKHGEVYTIPVKERFILPSSLQNWLKKH